MIKYRLVYLIVAFILISILTQSQNQSIQNAAKYKLNGVDYYLHQVEKGDGLYRLSELYNVSQDDISSANNESINGFSEGQIVLIPIIAGRNDDTSNSKNNQQFIFHTIEKGQTTYFLTQKYQVSADEIIKFNPEVKSTLQIGQVVKIPIKNQSISGESSGNEGFIIHVVLPDETIYSISKKYVISNDDLIDANLGISNGVIIIGMQLKIPVKSNKYRASQSSPINRSKNLEDKNFVYHYVLGGETIYSIAQKYHATVEEVLLANKGLSASQLPYGYCIKVPKDNGLYGSKSNLYIDHKVSKKETLYGIAKKYNADIDVIKKLNPNVNFSNLRKGTVLKVPSAEWIKQQAAGDGKSVISEVNTPAQVKIIGAANLSNFNYFDKKEVLKIAVLLPFNTIKSAGKTTSGSTEYVDEPNTNASVSGRTKIIIEFYEGMLMALENFKKQGVNIQLLVFDSGATIEEVKAVLQKPELTSVDLIIGPAHSDLIKPVSEFSLQHKIKMVNPFTTNNTELDVNPYIFQMTTPDSLLMEPISQIIAQVSSNQKVIIIRSAASYDVYEQNLTELIKRKIQAKGNGGNLIEVVEVKLSETDRASLEAELKNDQSNLIVIPSVNEVFINQVVNQLGAMSENNFTNFSIVGLPNWLKFQTIDPESIHRMNGHIISYYGVDYTLPKTQQFVQSYQAYFHTEPFAFQPHFQKSSSSVGYSRYSIWGYDIATYFIGARVTYGPQFESYFSGYQPELIQSNFHFSRISNWGGFYNDGLMILNFTRDFKVKCINY